MTYIKRELSQHSHAEPRVPLIILRERLRKMIHQLYLKQCPLHDQGSTGIPLCFDRADTVGFSSPSVLLLILEISVSLQRA